MKAKMQEWLDNTKDQPYATYSDNNVKGLSRQEVMDFLKENK
jgi:hypothetical protein